MFIVLEGPDGSGTTLHTALLAKRFARNGHRVVATAEPTRGPIGNLIRASLAQGDMDPVALQLLFCADRAVHCACEITPALARGETVICDRYALSTLAYGSAAGIDWSWLREVNKNFVQPSRYILLLPSLATCLGRLARRAARDAFEATHFQEEVYAAYERLARADSTIAVVDSSDTKEETAVKIWDIAKKLMR